MFCKTQFVFILVLQAAIKFTVCSLQGEEVAKWANAIGDELWMLGKEITKITEIEQKYAFLNARVGEKDPTSLLSEIKDNILRMMDRKMDAIRCIQQEAENVAENFTHVPDSQYKYYSSKWSPVDPQKESKLPKSLKRNKQMYLTLKVNNDTHFYNLPVNTNHSSVHVPTNVYDIEDKAAEAIQWSKELDKVFAQNYKSDPALSWQYFGSVSGIMRHYPAMHWEEHKKEIKNLFDTRIRTWFIEASTCTKDVVILIDNSGSMDGMGRHIGALTAYSILDTFSNNDYVNVLNYSVTTEYIVPCFESQLIQATKENIHVFKDAIGRLKPNGKTQVEQALVTAFKLLSDYRNVRGCNNENNTDCNQAIMILTDGLNANYSDTVLTHNYLFDGGTIPVRIFTYLIGKEVTNVEEIKWMSCANRGYYTHVQTLEQVTASVLQYIYVIARPLVLQAEDHPVSWTHAYADLTYDDATDTTINEPYRLLTSAAIPCFDRKINKMNDTRTAELLGVAGTDVPIDEFRKLIRPYKIGVNAYAFIVTNNGFVLMHPDLRPVYEGILKENYNSIDLTEVEQHYEDLKPREMPDSLEKLRLSLVNGEEGSMHNVRLKYHYDDNRRVSEEAYDYYFAPLEDTPFSLAIAIPNRYGNYSLDVGDEIQKNRHTGENLTSFFNGKWKIHPKWVYCKYHYLEGHEFDTPEEELVHFLGKMYDMDFKWERQYEPMEKEDINEIECGRKTLDDDDYYCDKQLVQRLIFDARNTYEPFKDKWAFQSELERRLFNKYNVSLRFVATMSGLTRWDYIFDELVKSKQKEFGDLHPRAIDEKWYKSAVLQHQYDTESFVYSVPFNYDSTLSDVLVTGSYAIFAKDAGIEAPGSVVGFQFSHAKLKSRVQEVSTRLSNQCSYCEKCGENLVCYVVDSSGYVIVSDNELEVGTFFGEIEGDILETMLQENVFVVKTLYDYQALCRWDELGNSSSTVIYTPLYYAAATIQWIIIRLLHTLMEINLYQLLDPIVMLAQEVYENSSNSSDYNEPYDDDDEDEGEYDYDDEDNADKYYACEKKISLFLLQQPLFIKDNFLGEMSTAERAFYVKRIPNSNLIFVAAENKAKVARKPRYSTDPERISKAPVWTYEEMNDTLLPCQKLYLNSLPRRRLTGCYNEHYLEREIEACGRSTPITTINLRLLILCFVIKSILVRFK